MSKSLRQGVSGKRKVLIIVGLIVAVIVVAYIGVSIYFQSHFYPGTTLNGMSVSGDTAEAVKEKTEAGISGYELTVAARGNETETIAGQQLNLRIDWDDSVETLIEAQNGFAWIVKLFSSDELTNETFVTYDENALNTVIAELDCMDESKQVQPVNASVSEYSDTAGYTLVPSQQGTAIDGEKLKQAVTESIYALSNEVDLDTADCYLEPEVLDDDPELLTAIDTLNQYVASSITYQVGDSTQVLDASTFHQWITLGEDLKPVIDEQQVSDYVKSLASTYNTCYSAKKFATSYNQTITVSRSTYGWKVDEEAERAQILEELQAGEPVSRDLNYSMTANSHGTNDYGNSYVEINLTAQHLFMYKNGVLITESDFVSGSVAEGHATRLGIHGITYTERDATLKGTNSNGSAYSSFVKYWMPFDGGIGMHDASWRRAFGASYYKRNGSHGCINLPTSAAKTIFDNISTNYPVIVYELAGTQSERGNAQDQAFVVIDAIRAIGTTIGLESESAIVSARAQYDALSDLAKTFVTNLDVLTADEATLAQLKAQAGV